MSFDGTNEPIRESELVANSVAADTVSALVPTMQSKTPIQGTSA